MHPWEAERINKERKIMDEYGLKNKKEIWRLETFLRKAKNNMKRLIPLTTKQAVKERNQIIKKLSKLGLLSQNATPDDVLSLDLEHVLNRRIQTLVFKKGIARTIKQARQFIVHGHIMVGDKVITSPSYLVSVDEEDNIKAKPRIQKLLTQQLQKTQEQKTQDSQKQEMQQLQEKQSQKEHSQNNTAKSLDQD